MNRKLLLAQAKNFFADLLGKINVFFNSYQWQEIAFCLKIALFIVSVLMILAIIVVLIRKSSL
jgi:hypothetical protein